MSNENEQVITTEEMPLIEPDNHKLNTDEPEAKNPDSEVQDTEKPAKKKLPFFLAGGLLILMLIYVIAGLPYQNKFFRGTIVNGTDISGMDVERASEAINNKIKQYILTLEEIDGTTETIPGNIIALQAECRDSLHAVLSSQNFLAWGIHLFQEKNHTIETMITYDEEKLKEAVNALSCMDKSSWAPSENAYFEYDEKEGYRIVPEIQGTEIQPDILSAAISQAICALDETLSFSEAQVYNQPEITADNPMLLKRLEILAPYMDMAVTYHFGEETEVLNIDTLHNWLTIDNNGELLIDSEEVETFVKGLEKKYNTAHQPKTLQTSYGPEVTIQRGSYGWKIDHDGETEALAEIIRSGISEDREPLYSQTAASRNVPEYGDSYVEINLTAQHLFLYKNGELLLESDFVSGNISRGNGTPDGVYPLTYKERDATLRGADYVSHVKYWMPFNGNIGMHDASWRSEFGGVIYKTNGSHGCINLPRPSAEIIFANIEKGFPVLCYFLDGTERDPNAPPPEEAGPEYGGENEYVEPPEEAPAETASE